VPTSGRTRYASLMRSKRALARMHAVIAVIVVLSLSAACTDRGDGPGFVFPPAAPTAPASSVVSGLYGPAIGADTLGNTQVGGPDAGGDRNTRVSYRFRAGTSSSLESIRLYLEDGPGYSGGDGGELTISLQADDGTPAHAPSGTPLASVTFRPGNPIEDRLGTITFGSPAAVTAGSLYHVVFENTGSQPTEDFVSVNGLLVWEAESPRQPKYTDLDWAQLVDNGGGWVERPRSTPILSLRYGDGVIEGMGYMEAWQHIQPAISGSNRVRERFKVSGPDRIVSSVSVRLKRDSGNTGNSPLAVNLETAAGELVAAGTIPAEEFPVGTEGDGRDNYNGWGHVTFTEPVTLRSGEIYHLILSAPSDTVFRAMPIRKGVEYGFDANTWFADGIGQFDDGSGWVGFEQPGGSPNSRQGDLQFYFQ
jgi:hypothetical protein